MYYAGSFKEVYLQSYDRNKTCQVKCFVCLFQGVNSNSVILGSASATHTHGHLMRFPRKP